jgi:hypothetical protein
MGVIPWACNVSMSTIPLSYAYISDCKPLKGALPKLCHTSSISSDNTEVGAIGLRRRVKQGTIGKQRRSVNEVAVEGGKGEKWFMNWRVWRTSSRLKKEGTEDPGSENRTTPSRAFHYLRGPFYNMTIANGLALQNLCENLRSLSES